MTRILTICRRIVLMSMVLAGLLAPVPLAAQSTPEASPETDWGPQFILRPADGEDGSYFTIEAEPGSVHTLTAVLGNVDDEPLTLRTYAGDGFTLVNGGFGVREEADSGSGISSWLDYDAGTLTFEPGQGIERAFTVTVPEDAAPGQYIAGIVLQTAEPIAVEGSAMFNQIIRKSVAVFITVPGEVTPSVELGTPQIDGNEAGQRVVVPVRNTGNVLLKPAGELVLTDASGTAVFTQPFVMGSVYAGMETTLEVLLPAALPEGEYVVTATFSDAETGVVASVPETSIALSRDVEAEAPLAISSAEVTPMPAADDVQFAAARVTIENSDAPLQGVQVILGVARDGQPVEDFPLASSVTLQQGETVVEQRYIPLDGWTPGEWTFTVTLESINPQTNAEATLVSVPVDVPILIGD